MIIKMAEPILLLFILKVGFLDPLHHKMTLQRNSSKYIIQGFTCYKLQFCWFRIYFKTKLTHDLRLNWVFPSTEESQSTDRGAEEENDNSCEKEGAGMKGEDERSISAPLRLSQERMEEVCRRLHSLQEHLKRLQVRGEVNSWRERWEYRKKKAVSRQYDGAR